MVTIENSTEQDPISNTNASFYARPHVHIERIPVGSGVPIGIECVTKSAVGIRGAYGTWGDSYNNEDLPRLFEQVMGESLANDEKFNLAELGFLYRQHITALSDAENLELEVRARAHFLSQAAYPVAGSQVKWRLYWLEIVVR